MRRIELSTDALEQLEEMKRSGMKKRKLASIMKTMSNLARFPNLGMPICDDLRKIISQNRSIIYRVIGNKIFVLEIMREQRAADTRQQEQL